MLNTARIEPGTTVAVFGVRRRRPVRDPGRRIAGAPQIIAVDIADGSSTSRAELGATDTVDASAGDPVQAIRELTSGGVDYAFEAIGLKKAAEQCVRLPPARRHRDDRRHDPDRARRSNSTATSFLREKNLHGCSMGSNRFRVDMPRYIDYYLTDASSSTR